MFGQARASGKIGPRFLEALQEQRFAKKVGPLDTRRPEETTGICAFLQKSNKIEK